MAKPKVDKQDVAELTGKDVSEIPDEVVKVEYSLKKKDSSKAREVSIGAVRVQDHTEDVAEELKDEDHKMIEIFVDEELHINGKRVYGLIKVPRHQAQSIIPMLQSKKRADIEVFTGRNFQVNKIAGRLEIKELSED